jgi:hypothetical protein
MKSRFFLALLCAILASCAGSPPMTVVDAVQPIRVAGETEPVAVGPVVVPEAVTAGEIGDFHGGLANIPYSSHSGRVLVGMERKFRLMVHDELVNSGYRVIGEKHNLISSSAITPPPGAVFEIGGTIEAVRYDTYSSVAELSTISSVVMVWTLTDLRKNELVYELKSEGEAKGPHEDLNVIVEAARGSFRKALSDQAFVAFFRK